MRATSELARILALPRRRIDDTNAHAELAEQLTALLKTPEGTMRLRPLQALALHDIGVCGGAFCPLETGGGKTLVSLMAAYILDSKQTILLLPAGLIEKTKRDWDRLAKHWLIPNNIRLFSYEMLGRKEWAIELERYEPDLIIADEVQRLKNRDAAVTRRVERWMEAHPDTRFVALSGTIMDKSLLEFGHILRWCLKTGAPIPLADDELEEWASALDEVVANDLRRCEPGALLKLAQPGDAPVGALPVVAARRGFRRRLVETPGVVSTVGKGEHVGASLYVRHIRYSMEPITEQHFEKLRGEMVTPDDWKLMTGAEVWMHARELALGFHQIWDPRPPEDWRAARRAWNGFVCDVLARSRSLDSPDQVASSVLAGDMPEGVNVLEAWRKQRDESGFVPNPVPVWHDDTALHIAAKWMAKAGGIVWTEHVPFALRLAELTGASYFGPKGLAADGTFIEDAPAESIIASIDANREGLNLQTKWWRNLITSPPERPGIWQQTIARTHRSPGQKADEVEVDIFLGCMEHANAWRRAYAGAEAVRDMTGAESKILIADVDWPTDLEIANFTGARWRAPTIKPFQIPTDA